MKIKSITVYLSDRNEIAKADVIYESGSETVEGLEKVQEKVKAFASQEEKEIREIIDDSLITFERLEKDISQSIDRNEIVEELRRLNPDVDIEFDESGVCTISVPKEKLILPKGFYYDDTYGITNKGKTTNGMYTYIDVRELVREDTETDTSSSETEEEVNISNSTDISEIMQELRRLNPDVDIEFDAAERICYTSVSPKKLVLPKGFYYNGKNGITNKHNTKTGVYISIDVRKMDKKKDNSGAIKGKIDELLEKAKKKPFVKITALALAAIIAFFVGKGLFIDKDGSKTKSGSDYVIEETITDDYTERPEDIPVVSYDEAENSLPATSDRFASIVVNLYNGNGVDDSDLLFAMDEINERNFQGTSEIGYLIATGQVTGQNVSTDLYSAFPKETPDYGVIGASCRDKNTIVESMYTSHSQSGTRNYVKQFLTSLIDFVYNGMPVNYNGVDYYFNDLTPLGRYIVVDMAQQMLTTDPNYIGYINGTRCDFGILVGEFAETYDTVSQNLVNRSTVK